MNQYFRKATSLGLFFIILVCWFSVHASLKPNYRIFVLHSYEENHICGQPQHDGVIEALKERGFVPDQNLSVMSYFMDTKRKNNTSKLIKIEARKALDIIKSYKPDVLITLDDNAFRTVGLELADTSIPVVFSGMNGQPEDYNKKKRFLMSRSTPGHNITGVYEKLHISDALRVHSRLFPGLHKVDVLVDTSPTGKAIKKQIELELAEEAVPCIWNLSVIQSWEEYQERILAINEDPQVGAIYPAALLLKDKSGKTYTAPEIFKWTVENSKKSEIAINYAFTHMGLFGGAAVDFHAMGYQAGEKVARILSGDMAGTIAIDDAVRTALIFNIDRAKQLGIEIPSDILLGADDVVSSAKHN